MGGLESSLGRLGVTLEALEAISLGVVADIFFYLGPKWESEPLEFYALHVTPPAHQCTKENSKKVCLCPQKAQRVLVGIFFLFRNKIESIIHSITGVKFDSKANALITTYPQQFKINGVLQIIV